MCLTLPLSIVPNYSLDISTCLTDSGRTWRSSYTSIMPSRVEMETGGVSEDARPHKRVKWNSQQAVDPAESGENVPNTDDQKSSEAGQQTDQDSSLFDEKITKVRLH
jgi:hypothetical protein